MNQSKVEQILEDFGSHKRARLRNRKLSDRDAAIVTQITEYIDRKLEFELGSLEMRLDFMDVMLRRILVQCGGKIEPIIIQELDKKSKK